MLAYIMIVGFFLSFLLPVFWYLQLMELRSLKRYLMMILKNIERRKRNEINI